MPLQDLSRITLHKTVIGVVCPSCGGDLQVVQWTGRSFWQRLIPCSLRKTYNYKCEGCGHRFRMYRRHS